MIKAQHVNSWIHDIIYKYSLYMHTTNLNYKTNFKCSVAGYQQANSAICEDFKSLYMTRKSCTGRDIQLANHKHLQYDIICSLSYATNWITMSTCTQLLSRYVFLRDFGTLLLAVQQHFFAAK